MLTNEEIGRIEKGFRATLLEFGYAACDEHEARELIAYAREAHALRERVMELENKTPEDDGTSEMFPGPCADALKQWRKMKRDHEAMQVLRHIGKTNLTLDTNGSMTKWAIWNQLDAEGNYGRVGDFHNDPADALLEWQRKYESWLL